MGLGGGRPGPAPASGDGISVGGQGQEQLVTDLPLLVKTCIDIDSKDSPPLLLLLYEIGTALNSSRENIRSSSPNFIFRRLVPDPGGLDTSIAHKVIKIRRNELALQPLSQR